MRNRGSRLFFAMLAVLGLGGGLCRDAFAEVLVSRATTWRYRKGTAEASEPRDDWRLIDFDDSAWPKGPLPIGFGEAVLNTTLPDMQNSYSSIFVRKTFTVSSLDSETRLRASVLYDDGFVIWINGEQVADRNEPDGQPLYNSFARVSREDATYEANELADPEEYLDVGENVIAVQVFNYNIDGTDCKLDVELSTFKRCADTRFSADRGFYDTDFWVTISTTTPGATIRYTTNGSPPTDTTGSTGGTNTVVHITTTTCLRAAAFKSGAGYEPSDVDTQSYLFLGDVLTQTRPAGYPTTWGGAVSSVQADYAMDPSIVARYGSTTWLDAFKSIPSLSVVMDVTDLFGTYPKGIYAETSEDTNLARAASAELIYPPGYGDYSGFQSACGVRTHSHANVKRALRLVFESEFGPRKLDYPFFEDDPIHADTAVERFDQIVLRCNLNDAWTGSTTMDPATYTFTRDQWARDALIDMTGYGSHGIWVHLYLNGMYWGLYNPAERPDHRFTAEYFGGESEHWFACNHGYEQGEEPTNGDPTRFNYMRSVASASTDINVMREYLDTAEFADYLILAWYDGNGDWPGNNWYAGMPLTPPGPAKFFTWDAEKTWYNYPGQYVNEGGWVQPPFVSSTSGNWLPRIFRHAWQNQEFRTEFADRIYRHCYNDGALTDANALDRWRTLSNRVYEAVICESARWGDIKDGDTAKTGYVQEGDGTYPVYTREDHWLPAIRRIHNIMDGNVARFVGACRNTVLAHSAYRVYPSLDPPAFHQHGGAIASGFRLTMSSLHIASSGTIYYTVDGTDPRRPGGSRSGSASAYGGPILMSRTTHVRARLYKTNSSWSAVHAATFNFTAHYSKLCFTELLYNPLGGGAFEFVEIKNTGTSTRGLSDMQVTGIGYTFPPGVELGPEEFAVLVADEAVFTSRYPNVKSSVAFFGQYGGRLDNGGERVALKDCEGRTVTAVRYNDKDPWPAEADGDGYSLVVVDVNGNPADPANWRASNLIGGSPGYDDGEPYRVVVNEALTHTDLPETDAIELYNAGSAGVSIGGWFLSDSPDNYRKYPIPGGTTIAAGGYVVFDENDFNTDTNDPACFALDSHGDEVYLTQWDANDNLLYLAEARFGGAQNGEAFGRHVRTDGESDFVAQSVTNTLGGANAYPRVGPVVINEILYHPGAGADEFIELYNASDSSVKLYDSDWPTNTWVLDGAVGFAFPGGAQLGAGEYLLVVATNAAGFRAKYAIPAAVQIFGPYTGVLDNGGDSVKLWRPDTPDELGVPRILVDRVKYDDNSPWPEGADGDGPSLERIAAGLYGNDPANWSASLAAGGTPGAANSGVLLSRTASWKYHDRGMNLGTAWRAPAYDDSGWEDGNAPLGYAAEGAYPDLDTELSYGDDPDNKPITTYFRRTFLLGADPADVSSLTLRATYDDGFVAYLNGEEIQRAAMPAGTIEFTTPATSHTAADYETFGLNGHIGRLVRGVNVLAVEVHQSGPTSSDLYVDLELTYEQSTAPTVELPLIAPGDGTVFTNSVQVALSTATAGATIFYTTSGVDPTTGSTRYTAPFTLTDTATVKARAYKDAFNPSAIAVAMLTKQKETVATPTITPDGGDFYGSVQVTLSTATAGATIFYTTDGTAPTTGSARYTAAFTLTASRTVKARAFKFDYNDSAVAAAAFTDRTPTVQFDASASAGSESGTPVGLGVSLSGTSPQTVRVDYAVTGGTAGSGADYSLPAGTLTFSPGQTAGSLSVAIMDDAEAEGAETIVVTLGNPSNATLGARAIHTYTITDNDSLFTAYNDLAWTNGQTTVNITTFTVGESGQLVDFATGQGAGVNLAVQGGSPDQQYRPDRGAGPNPGTDAYDVFNGKVDCLGLLQYDVVDTALTFTGLDPTLRYEFVLFGNRDSASYADRTTVTVLSGAAGFENRSTPGAVITATAIAGDTTIIANGYNTIDGHVARFADIDPGADGTFVVTVGDSDTKYYLNAIMLKASRPAATVPQVAFVAGASSGGEAAGPALIGVALSTSSTAAVTVAYAVTGGSAAGNGADYTLEAGSLTFEPGQTSKSLSLTIHDDAAEEDNETVELALSSPVNATLGAPAVHTYTIADDDTVLVFTAYNDLAWTNNQAAANTTHYMPVDGDGNPFDAGGELVDHADGSGAGACVAISVAGVPHMRETRGEPPAADTDAYGVFYAGGVFAVDLTGDIRLRAAGDTIVLAFTNLDSTLRYEFALYGDYYEIDRVGNTRVEIADADSYRNTSSMDATGGDSIVSFGSLNHVSGYVARFSDVVPGADGDFTVTIASTDNGAVGYDGYVNGFRLQACQPPLTVKIAKGSVWRYAVGSAEASSPVAAWRYADFDDSGWGAAVAPVGYGDPQIATTVDIRYTYSCLYLRKTFLLASAPLVRELRLWTSYDDGFILWLNGEEIKRLNAPGSPGEWMPFNTFAPLGDNAAWQQSLSAGSLPALRTGTNVAALQLFNMSLDSSDLVVDLELAAIEGSALATEDDTDRDGMPDDWEVSTFGSTNQTTEADPDGDGLSNMAEFVGGTSPTSSDSRFTVDMSWSNGNLIVQFPTIQAAGTGYDGLSRYYALEYRTGGLDGAGVWQSVTNLNRITGDGLPARHQEPGAAEAGYYRARVWME
ncbi:MAG: chitobiase/beta-hexosaminidase C-terminal domain-containing protein [Kiritimatiellae bacterium]|nr:chitobiase/beta-hexosaminidase C-terminal domain-containing protein [Kiritimatiellia bacterium]